MAKTDKTFPLRMDNETYRRLQVQAQRFGTSVTGYIRHSFVVRLENDESSMQSVQDHCGNDGSNGKVEIVAEHLERHETKTDELQKGPATAVRSWFDRLSAGGRNE